MSLFLSHYICISNSSHANVFHAQWFVGSLVGSCFFEELNAKLKRMPSPSVFGSDIEELTFHAEMQTDNRFRFKVC